MEAGETGRRSRGNGASPRWSKVKPHIPTDDSSEDEFASLERGLTDATPVEEEIVGNRPKNLGYKVSFSHIPGTMTEEEFLQYFGDLPPHNYFFYKPPFQLGMMPGSCTAVINFLDKNDVADWFERLHGVMLTDARGEEFVIEGDIMVNQQLPKIPVVERDELEGTIEETDEYQEFLDLWEDTDGVFKEPPVPFEVLQETMLREIDEKKAKDNALQDTPLVLHLREKHKGEREKTRLREEAEAAIKLSRDRRRQERREQRDREKKERRDREREERIAREKLRKEAARKAKKAKQSSKKQSSEAQASAPLPEGGEALTEANSETKSTTRPASSAATPRSPGEETKVIPTATIEVPSTSSVGTGRGKEKDKGFEGRYGGGKSNRGSSKPWDRETTWSRRSNKWDHDKDKSGIWRKDTRGEAKSKEAPEGTVTVTSLSALKQDSTPKNEGPSTLTAAGGASDSKLEEKREPKKKMVKKIVRVKKVRSDDNVAAGGSDAGGSSSNPAKVKTVEKSGGAKADMTTTAAGSSSTSTTQSKQGEDKRRKNRPDREVYRPGAWRRNSGAGAAATSSSGGTGQQTQKESSSSDKSKPASTGVGDA